MPSLANPNAPDIDTDRFDLRHRLLSHGLTKCHPCRPRWPRHRNGPLRFRPPLALHWAHERPPLPLQVSRHRYGPLRFRPCALPWAHEVPPLPLPMPPTSIRTVTVSATAYPPLGARSATFATPNAPDIDTDRCDFAFHLPSPGLTKCHPCHPDAPDIQVSAPCWATLCATVGVRLVGANLARSRDATGPRARVPAIGASTLSATTQRSNSVSEKGQQWGAVL